MAAERGPNRKIILSDSINAGTVKDIVQRILDINEYDRIRNEKEKDYVVESIDLIVNSPGGAVYDGNALLSIIENSDTPVHTYCYGKAMSMGFAIFLAGKKRFVGKYATFMYHDISQPVAGSLEEHKRSVAEMERMSKQYDSFVLSKTTLILQEKLNDYKTRVENWFIGPEEAVKLGIAHEII
ncbi:ATP-dependent Clp protease proteolytic subunit [compost metagenome]